MMAKTVLLLNRINGEDVIFAISSALIDAQNAMSDYTLSVS